MRSTRRTNGFTLLEVLVALAVVTISMAALIKVGGDHAGTSSYLRDRTLAHWVGMNVVAEARIAGEWPAIGRFQGSEEMANHAWYWRAEVSKTADEAVRRLDVTVHGQEGSDAPVLARLVAYLARPAATTGGQPR